jgi:cellobiose phosphorylase
VTDTGFFEAYDGKTGAPNDCAGVLMNNGGFLWGFFEGVLGIEVRGDELRLRASVPKRILPAKARIHYRGADLEIRWMIGLRPSASLDGKSIALRRDGYYQLKLTPEPQQTYLVEMVQSAS